MSDPFAGALLDLVYGNSVVAVAEECWPSVSFRELAGSCVFARSVANVVGCRAPCPILLAPPRDLHYPPMDSVRGPDLPR